MRPNLLDHSIVQDNNLVGPAHGRKSMGYHEERSPVARLVERILDKLLRGPIHRRRRLIEEQNFGFTDKCSSDGEALFLADGEVAGARTQWRLKGLHRKVKR